MLTNFDLLAKKITACYLETGKVWSNHPQNQHIDQFWPLKKKQFCDNFDLKNQNPNFAFF